MRADRLISIIMRLQQAGRMTAKELAELLEVSERTIYRDMDVLSGMGVPVQSEGGLGGGFTLPATYRTKVDGLHTPEIHALFLQMNEQPFKQLGIDHVLRSALLKLLGSLSNQHREDVDWIRNRVFIDMGSWRKQTKHGQEDGKLQLIRQAVWEQRRVHLTYTNRLNTTVTLSLDSYGLVLKAGIWFVVGSSEDIIRALRVSNIQAIEPTNITFERPESFRLESYWEQWLTAYQRRQFPYVVEAELLEEDASARISRYGGVLFRVSEEAGVRRAEIGFESEETAVRATLALAGLIQVRAPLAIGARIREAIEQLQASYNH
ncbi:putative DNA-binding transcriptional regulator YafY [Paenibacillus cellulosilyticus]|uniref:Putative DNA-binding transcriptional regulator YafY n=1 Tax=Paenibacillus cellulosilyticus TaxID=375489 RepID=A0A2V2YVL6_9BACL|nr:WYL domain-containing protein [Paenibacillus cellulosilyticus]PWW05139.1 putative DNA-binding transcriptional regulator YafY [Paenibacillus cellulosilyticus]QKS48684.1 WYL domain-containing protein [Paenibacillus cellulosilyticus]